MTITPHFVEKDTTPPFAGTRYPETTLIYHEEDQSLGLPQPNVEDVCEIFETIGGIVRRPKLYQLTGYYLFNETYSLPGIYDIRVIGCIKMQPRVGFLNIVDQLSIGDVRSSIFKNPTRGCILIHPMTLMSYIPGNEYVSLKR